MTYRYMILGSKGMLKCELTCTIISSSLQTTTDIYDPLQSNATGGWGLCGLWAVASDDVLFFDPYKNLKKMYIHV